MVRRADSKIGRLRALLEALLNEHDRDGTIPTNARFLFYELIQRGQLSKQRTGVRRPDQDLHDALMDLREDGLVPWDWIVDETRSIEDYSGYASVGEGVLAQLPQIHLDPWRGDVPVILTESRSLAGTLRSIVAEYHCKIASTNGQVGGFLRTDVAPLLENFPPVLYVGDHDPAGNQIEANTRKVLVEILGAPLHWGRVALTRDQIQRYSLPIILKHDRRYRDGRPHEAVETEALSQRLLLDLLRDALEALLPEPLEAVLIEREQAERAIVRRLLEEGA